MFNLWPSTIYQPTMTGSPQQPVLPASLAKNPDQWTKQEVGVWLKWCSEEFSIEPVSPERIDMNGKALCMLQRGDFMERIPKNGDLLFNALQKLIHNKVCHNSPMTSMCSVGGPMSLPLGPFPIKTERVSPLMPMLTPTNTNTTSMHAPSIPRPILSRPVASILPPTGTSSVIHNSKPYCTAVSTLPGILSPAPSNVDTESASSDNGSVSDPEGAQDNEQKQPMETNNDRLLPTTIKTEIHSIQSAFQTVNTIKPEAGSECRLLWEFIHQLLQSPRYSQLVCWENQKDLVFRINNPTGLAHMWGQQKNRTNMTYEKLSRALRYYYRMNIIKKVSGKRLTYKFMQQPSMIQKGQRGAKPHNKCDLPLFQNRFPYPGLKEEPAVDSYSVTNPVGGLNNNGEQGSSNGSRGDHEIHDKTDQPSSKSSSLTSNVDSENFEQQGYLQERSTISIPDPRIASGRFHFSPSYERKHPNLKPLDVRTNIQNDIDISPDVKLNLDSFGLLSPLSFETYPSNNKRLYPSTPTSYYNRHFKDNPQDEPEDLSFTSKKKRRASEIETEMSSQDAPPSDENKLLPLLINFKKTTNSNDDEV